MMMITGGGVMAFFTLREVVIVATGLPTVQAMHGTLEESRQFYKNIVYFFYFIRNIYNCGRGM